jgi:peptide/nickel transport system substrate-binding protein
VEFGVLGPVVVRRDGAELPLGGPKPRALLAVLLLHANQPVSRDALIDALWGERAPATAKHTLDNYVSRLRTTIGRDRLVTARPGYMLRVGPGELDLERFEHLEGQGRRELASGAFDRASETLRAALLLWRGSALADLLYETSLGSEAARLEELRLNVVEERIEVDLALGQSSELVPELEKLLREHPLRERLVYQLMLALYRAGRQAAALDAYRAARRRLAEELGLEPGPQLQQLERQILDHDAKLNAPAEGARLREVRRWRLPRRRVALALFASVAAAAAVLAGVLVGTGGSAARRETTATNQLVLLRARDGRIATSIAQTSTPAALASGGRSLWVSDPNENAVLRIDPSGQVTERVPLTVQPGDVAVGAGAVWVAATAGDTITRIDPSTDAITQTIPLGAAPAGICFCEGALWVADPSDRALLEINPGSGRVSRTITLSASQPTSLVAGDGALWVVSYDTGTVTEVDPRSGTPLNVVPVGQGPASPTFGGGSVWVANRLDGTLTQIAAGSATVVRTIPAGGSPSALIFAGGLLWVADEFSGTVLRIDPASGAVPKRVLVGGAPVSLVATPAGVWVGTGPSGEHRGGTLVLLDTLRFRSIDPQVDYETTPPGFLGLVNDTLVAYDHTAGTDGFQLVPDLALRLPQPMDDGRTYVFELRPGLHYSNGRPVRASDFARSMIRLFRVGSPGTSFFSVVVGGPACVSRPMACRLTGGVVADNATRTVTFHLIAPDPDFLFKLALGFVVPIPPGTPMHEVRSRPIPGTGPYEFVQVGARQFTFVRNPRFVEWSHAAQPNGNPDRIVWRFGLTPDAEIRAVAAGHGDWTGDFPSNLSPIIRRYPTELHSNVFPGGYFVQIDTRHRPFDDARVRRALNYAVDRSVIVRLSGGSVANAPLCQVIPPGLPGYRRYCPYTLGPRADGRWTAPDLARAVALVAASGTRGERVTVWTVSDTGSPEPAAPYLADVLKRLGYRADVRVITSEELAKLSPNASSQMQLHLVSFGPDYPSAAEIYSLFLSCNGQFAHHQFCDQRLDRTAEQAEALRLSDPRRSAEMWASIDHTLVDRAVWVPLITQRVLDFVSPRLRNYEFSPVYHFLPAQAWLR